MANFWNDALRQAKQLSLPELSRHAHVSIDNRHSCQSCFTCACAVELCERQRRHARDFEAAKGGKP